METVALEFSSFVRKPFRIEAVQITVDNIGEIARFVGTIREKEDGSPYIEVDRRLVPNIMNVHPGYWLTKMRNNVRCYSDYVFKAQFVGVDEDIEAFLSHLTKDDDVDPNDVFPEEGKLQDGAVT